MFRKTDPQTSLLEPAYALSPAKQRRLDRTWAMHFREHCLPLIAEEAFAACYCPDNGRPNVPVRLVVGLLVLKDMFDLTDTEALESADFDVRWQTALGLAADDLAPCQKTLHNFRALLAADARAAALFTTTTDGLFAVLGLSSDRQRLDSTQICSNITLLSRLSRFCETHRLLLHGLARHAPAALGGVPVSVQRRYVRADGTDAPYEDARSSEGRRRLAVCARDAWRLVDALRGVELPEPAAAAYALVVRLFDEQCLPLDAPVPAAPEDSDATEPSVPVRLRGKGEVAAGGLQSPHDPDATYGHKGVGYTATLCETVGNGEKPELITHVQLDTAFASDQQHTVPVVEALRERGLQPRELLADASFASTANVLACQTQDTELVGPVTGGASSVAETPQIIVAWRPDLPPTACSLGVPAATTQITEERVVVRFAALSCAGCPRAGGCPTRVQADGTRVYRASLAEAVTTQRRWAETTAAYQERYRWRAGIEATNSEVKRRHGLGHLRVRGKPRVFLALCLKALACNCKRALQYWGRLARQAAGMTYQPA
jgi:hypothetical protein